MSRSVICAHCGTVVALEPRTDRIGTRLSVHLRGVHREVVAPDELPRWAQLFEHFETRRGASRAVQMKEHHHGNGSCEQHGAPFR